MAATGLTWLQIINRTLSRLRERTVAANNTTTYSSTIGALVNTVADEIQDACYWYAMRDTYSINAVPSTTTYTLTSSGMNAVVIDAWNQTKKRQIDRGTNVGFDAKFFAVDAVETGDVQQFIENGFDASYDLKIDIWPSPAATQALKFNVYKPQPQLTADGDVPLVPQSVLLQGVYAYAIQERGDDGGDAGDKEMAKYREMLASAVARELGRDPSEMDWVPV